MADLQLQLYYNSHLVYANIQDTRAHQEMRYPNMTRRIILSV